jgi:hypothetical protein
VCFAERPHLGACQCQNAHRNAFAHHRNRELQRDQAARIARIQATGTGGICPCLRRVAGCATPTGSAGHAGATANLKLTFHLGHSAGADHCVWRRRVRAKQNGWRASLHCCWPDYESHTG